ncbi:MAG: three-Cys-motif partner protein TcmP [Dokdonella sp.]|nr:three-Cys-motif partner protein TcmP [Dokdonella sp.]
MTESATYWIYLKKNVSNYLSEAGGTGPNLKLVVEYHSESFESLYPTIKARIKQAKCSNIIFNLDQCGYTHVTAQLIRDIMTSWQKAEVLLTFMISTLLAYLSPDKEKGGARLDPVVREKIDTVLRDQGLLKKQEWLGECEKIVFDHLRSCAPYVSPFSIANPDGWKYWLMHFANSYRARQVYNNVLHADGLAQAHFGRLGLNMLAYDALAGGGQLYIFDRSSRVQAIESLNHDIPRFIAESGDMMGVEEFYAAAYSETPAHSDDIHKSIIDNPDIEVITPNGGRRREAKTIDVGDTLKLKSQRSIIFGFK